MYQSAQYRAFAQQNYWLVALKRDIDHRGRNVTLLALKRLHMSMRQGRLMISCVTVLIAFAALVAVAVVVTERASSKSTSGLISSGAIVNTTAPSHNTQSRAETQSAVRVQLSDADMRALAWLAQLKHGRDLRRQALINKVGAGLNFGVHPTEQLAEDIVNVTLTELREAAARDAAVVSICMGNAATLNVEVSSLTNSPLWTVPSAQQLASLGRAFIQSGLCRTYLRGRLEFVSLVHARD